MSAGKRKLRLLDRLRGWHWEERWAVHHGEVVDVALVRVRNYCGCILQPGD